MARGVNKVILIGNCGQDPETRYSASGSAITNISIATSESWKDKQTGQTQERTEWHRVVFFNRLAEIAGEYLKKGGKVYIEGGLRTRKWQDQQGQERYTTEIVANEMQMLDSRAGGAQPNYNNNPAQQPAMGSAPQTGAPAQNMQPPQQQPYQSAPTPAAPAQPPSMDSFDDDIPF